MNDFHLGCDVISEGLCGSNVFVFSCNYNGGIEGNIRCASVDSAAVSLTSAEPHVGGGITRAIRCICAISAELSEPPAMPKSHFGGYKGAVRLPIQRTNVQNMQIVQ